jgi:predicted nicotinamide N-methyase
MAAPDKNIKEAPSDIIQFDDNSIEIALLQDLLFEDISATELANISRTDLIDGQEVIYEPIKNLSSVRQEFNPNNVVATAISTNYFSRFGIDLDSRGIYEPYFDENGDLVIEVEDVRDGEEIQVQLLLNGTINLVDES